MDHSKKTESICVVEAINKLTEQMRTSITELSARFDQMESSLDNKIKHHVKNSVTPAFTKIKEEFNAEISKVREEIKAVSDQTSQTINQTYAQAAGGNSSAGSEIQTKSLNFVVRNLRESDRENVVEKVNNLITEGLKIRSISVADAVRKPSHNENLDGIIVATCRNKEDKNTIMKAKSSLKNSRRYQQVFIEHDRSKEERKTLSNLRTIANLIGNEKVTVRGSRLIYTGQQRQRHYDENNQNRENSSNHYRTRDNYRERQRSRNRSADRRDNSETRRRSGSRERNVDTPWEHVHQRRPRPNSRRYESDERDTHNRYRRH